MDLVEEFGNRLREALVSAGLTQAALAKELGVHANVVNNWACGKGYPSSRTLRGWHLPLGSAPTG